MLVRSSITPPPLQVDGEQGIDVAREPLRDGGGPCDKPVIARHSIIHVRWLQSEEPPWFQPAYGKRRAFVTPGFQP